MNDVFPLGPHPPLRLLLLGYGNVAQAFLPLLVSRSEWLGHQFSVRPVITGVGTRTHGFFLHAEGIDARTLVAQPDPLHWFSSKSHQMENAEAFLQAGKVAGASILIELTTLQPQNGQPALDHIRTALLAGMDVITANKGPIAHAQAELLALAQQQKVQLRFESTVMDGLPLINLAQFTLQAVGIRSFRALLNTTSSVVLSLIEQGHPLEEAIHRAQEIGVAESNPWHDLDGWDAVMKTTILANNLLGGQLTPFKVKREGIRSLSNDEIRTAAAQGTPLRLVSQASRQNGNIFAEVSPQRLHADDVLRIGKGTTSIISLETEAMGAITLIEHEPKVAQTAYGVLSDLIIVLQQRRN
jgi:homoserine dehydrogenase